MENKEISENTDKGFSSLEIVEKNSKQKNSLEEVNSVPDISTDLKSLEINKNSFDSCLITTESSSSEENYILKDNIVEQSNRGQKRIRNVPSFKGKQSSSEEKLEDSPKKQQKPEREDNQTSEAYKSLLKSINSDFKESLSVKQALRVKPNINLKRTKNNNPVELELSEDSQLENKRRQIELSRTPEKTPARKPAFLSKKPLPEKRKQIQLLQEALKHKKKVSLIKVARKSLTKWLQQRILLSLN